MRSDEFTCETTPIWSAAQCDQGAGKAGLAPASPWQAGLAKFQVTPEITATAEQSLPVPAKDVRMPPASCHWN